MARTLENGQKIILGGMLLNAARRDPKMRDWLLEEVVRSVTREMDQKHLKPLLDDLQLEKDKRAAKTVRH